MPRAWHPKVDALTDAELAAFVEGGRGVLERSADAIPQHAQFSAKHCAAEAARGTGSRRRDVTSLLRSRCEGKGGMGRCATIQSDVGSSIETAFGSSSKSWVDSIARCGSRH